MTNGKITTEDLAGMIQKGFNENSEQHQQISKILDNHAVILIDHTEILKSHTELLKDHTERLKRIEKKLEGIVYRKEFEGLEERVKVIEESLAIKKQ